MVWSFPCCLQAASKLNIGLDDKVWHAPLAACGIGGTMVLVFNIMTCVILIRYVVLVPAGACLLMFCSGYSVVW